MNDKFNAEAMHTTKNEIPFTVEPVHRGTLTIGNTLKRKRKGHPDRPAEPWAIVRDVLTAAPADDTSVYVAALCEGVGELGGQWFVWRLYFTNNRHGKRQYGQYGPQAPLRIDKWLSEQISIRGWYTKVDGRS